MATDIAPRLKSFTSSELYKIYDSSIIQAQNVQRLRINRVALVQSLRVEHVLPRLIDRKVLTEDEKKTICGGKTQGDRTRTLIDILPSKAKETDWYNHFHDALRHPDTRSMETRRKYQILLEFLDNTIIMIPPKPPAKPKPPISPVDSGLKQRAFPRFEPLPSISDDGGSPDKVMLSKGYDDGYDASVEQSQRESALLSRADEEKGTAEEHLSENMNKDEEKARKISNELVKDLFNKQVSIPENYKSLIQKPEEHFEALEKSTTPSDCQQLIQEKCVFRLAQHVEGVFALEKRKQLPPGVELCFSQPVEAMLKHPNLYHLYFKYFYRLQVDYTMYIPREITESFCDLVRRLGDARDDVVRQHVVEVGFQLFDFMHAYGEYNKADSIILELMKYAATCPELDNWMAIWEGLVRMMSISNTNVLFSETDNMYQLAVQMGDKIKTVSFGLDLLDESQVFTELSIMMREQGSLGPAYEWCKKALKEVEADNHKGIIETLCNAVLCFCSMWNVKKAEELALVVVRYARELFGENSPAYVKALIHFVHYSNEFRQDDMGVEVAKLAVEKAHRVYGGAPSLLVAQAHEVLAKALVVSLDFKDDAYFEHAQKSWKAAMEILPEEHPRLAMFRYSLAQILQWRAMHVDSSERAGNLVYAETEAKAAVNVFKHYWGEYSVRLAQSFSLLGQIYAKMDRRQEAEQMLVGAHSVYKLSVHPRSNLLCLIKATIGTFYRTIDKPLEAIDLLKECIENADSGGVYLKWIHMSFDSLITLYKATNQHEVAIQYELMLADWLKRNPRFKQPVSWEELGSQSEDLDLFLQKFFVLETKLKAFRQKRGLRNLAENKVLLEKVAQDTQQAQK